MGEKGFQNEKKKPNSGSILKVQSESLSLYIPVCIISIYTYIYIHNLLVSALHIILHYIEEALNTIRLHNNVYMQRYSQ